MKQKLIQTLILLAALACVRSLSGANKYWDANGETAGFGTAGGIWGADTNWSADVTGSSLPGAANTTVDDNLFFGTTTAGLAAGTITVDSTNQTFRTMTFGAASGPITITGGTLKLAAPASKVSAYNASNTIASVLAGVNGLHKYTPPVLSYTNFLTETGTLLYPNANLADYANAGGVLWGGLIDKIPANAYFFVNSSTSATFQLQALHGSETVCVKVELTQAGANIEGRAIYAKTLSSQQLGFDFDGGGTPSDLATSSSAPGYGVSQTRLSAPTRSYEPFLTTSPTIVLKNASLADISSIAASMAGNSVSDSPAPTTPYYFQNNGTTCTAQMQAYNGLFTKCVKVELAQSGADVVGKVLYSRYVEPKGSNRIGFDFDSGGTMSMNIATDFTALGYGLCQLRVPHKLRLAGKNTYTGDTTIDEGGVEIGGNGFLGGGVYAGAIATAGQLIYSSTSDQTLVGNISGQGFLVMDSREMRATTKTHSSFLTTQSTLIFPNTSLAGCTDAGGVLGGWAINNSVGGSGSSGLPLPAEAFFFTNNGTKASWQLQAIDGPHTKCVTVELTQTAGGIAARAHSPKYLLNEHNLGFDFESGGLSMPNIATSYSAPDYGVAETTITLDDRATLTLAGVNNTYTGGTMVNSGTMRVTGSANSLPSSGNIVINDGGNLTLSVPDLVGSNAEGVGRNNPITVNSGGTLTVAKGFNIGHSRRITLDGGTLNCIYTENNDSANYINNLVLRNGARVIGYKIRVAYHAPGGNITVSGTTPSSIEAGINMAYGSARTLTLNVADVTGDDSCDLFIPGVIRDYTNLPGTPIIKNGAGTVSLSGANTFAGPITITAGTVALGTNNTLNAANKIVLNGGTLDMGAFTNTVSTLSLSANSVIALGEGRLSFADSSAATWASGATLTLTGTLGPETLRIGTNDDGLTPAQLSAITYNGQGVRLRSDGYLSQWPKGTVIQIR